MVRELERCSCELLTRSKRSRYTPGFANCFENSTPGGVLCEGFTHFFPSTQERGMRHMWCFISAKMNRRGEVRQVLYTIEPQVCSCCSSTETLVGKVVFGGSQAVFFEILFAL